VLAPANTTTGRLLDANRSFRDALRLRVYTRVRERLERLGGRTGGLTGTVSLPTPTTPAGVERVLDSVRVGPRQNGTALRVTLRNVSVQIRREGRVVGKQILDPTVTVETPLYAVHERTGEFERRLNRGPTGPGLGQRLTGHLYPVAWTRGYAQYGGVPVGNVVANRHVALLTNGAVLDMQRRFFGAGDPVGERALGLAAVEVGLTDVLTDSGNPHLGALQRARELASTGEPLDRVWRPTETLDQERPGPGDTTTVDLAGPARDAFLAAQPDIEAALEATYTVEVRRTVSVRDRETEWLRSASPPGRDWHRVDEETDTEVTVTERSVPPAAAGETGHVLATSGRRVERRTVETETWRRGNETVTTRSVRVDRATVAVTLVGSHDGGPAPDRPVATVHERGGPLDGPNLAGVRERARERLLSGTVDELARRAIGGGVGTKRVELLGERPAELRAWVHSDLVRLRARLADISVRTTRGAVATFEANVAAKLRDRLQKRSERLRSVPTTYGSVAERARVAARVAYLDRVAAALAERAAAHEQRRERFLSGLPGDARDVFRGRTRPEGGAESAGDRPVRMAVDTTPAYLTTAAVGPETAPRLGDDGPGHPLAVRNHNAIALPYGDVADAVVGAIFGPERVRLRTAAQTLRATRGVDPPNGSVAARRERLREAVASGTDAVREAMAREIATSVETDDPDGKRRLAAVDDGLAAWETTAGRALALTNGSAIPAVTAAVDRRWELSERRRDLLALRLERTVERVRTDERAQVPKPLVNDSRNLFRAVLEAEAKRVVGSGVERGVERVARRVKTEIRERTASETVRRVAGRSLSELPQGVPVAPAPGLWYATVNAWEVAVRGEYESFVVRVPHGGPVEGSFTYVRDGDRVRLDVDDDGTREVLGRASRLGFQTRTYVAVAVPPGPQGVGDVDGQAVETSPGWPRPGWE
jgi:hypothetical protein